jgi:hypothetical protein
MNLKTRIAKLERGVTENSIKATAADGVIRIRRDSLLPLTCAAMRRRWAAIQDEPLPVSPYDATLDRLKNAGTITSAEPMLEIACDMLRRNDE